VYVTDMRHLVGLEDPAADAPGPAKKLAAYLGDIVTVASVATGDVCCDSGLRCKRRPGRRPCPGTILFVRVTRPSRIEWSCPSCRESGTITNWERTPWDCSGVRERFEHERAPDGGMYH
jgi:hypothetical protein